MSFYRSVLPRFGILIMLSMVVACGQGTFVPTPSTQEPIPTATPIPPRQLTVCLGQEPSTLYPVNNPSSVAKSVLAAVYDGPFDTNSYNYQPVILERLPSIGNGDAQLFSKQVAVGDEVVDSSGAPVTLVAGTMVRPSGCQSDTCAVKYDGNTSLQMDQMQVTFRMLPDLTWSDGEPLTADDSVYAYQVDKDPATVGSKYVLDRTQSYEATDTLSVQWWGKPGFIDSTYFINFWSPLPAHLWKQIPVNQLAETSETARTPVGWGAYSIREWVSGDHITLVKNPYYFRKAGGLPKFDILTFRFVTDPGSAISDLLAGTCDILDPSIALDGQVDVLRSMAKQDQLQALFSTVPTMEELALGIQPAAYDNQKVPAGSPPDYFSDPRVRQAVAMCLDRQKVVDSVLSGLTYVPNSYLPQEHPLYNPNITAYSYNVAAAGQLLDQAGWQLVGGDPTSPRQSLGSQNIPAGTPLEVTYVTSNATQRQQVSSILAASLAQCGIKVHIQYLDSTVLYAGGPQGVLFGRNFDLAEFAMGSTGIESSCGWYTTSAIPNNSNHWVGENVSGYSSPAFDAACLASLQSLPDEPAHTTSYAQAQAIFSQDLPVIPLYWRVKSAAAWVGICHFSLDPTASSNLWNIEAIDSGSDCQP